MKILIITVGTRGDVQPYLALAHGLQAVAHEVWLATDSTFESFVSGAGVNFKPIQADPRQAMQEDIRHIGGNPIKFMRWLNRQFRPLARDFFRDVKEAAEGMDAILFAALAFPAYHVALGRDIPSLAVYLQPVTPTRFFSVTAAQVPSWLPFRGLINQISSEMSTFTIFAMTKGVVDECRQEMLGLPKTAWRDYSRLNSPAVPIVYGYSRHVTPIPPDWGDWLYVTGYWFLEQDNGWRPSPALATFLRSGPPPIYIGFGSMVDQEAEEVSQMVLKALARSGRRAILLGGWSRLGEGQLPSSVLRLDWAPHHWLFPQMAAVIHHGGAGTTAAGLKAGVPNIIVPYFADQPFWASRVRALGVGPEPIPRQKLTAERLAAAIEIACTNRDMQRRAQALGRKIQAEDGVGTAVPLIERLLRGQLSG
ncbi:MAG: glycosyltransferase [Chloroflexota bacterium]|jgi:UDP:flavonoid glycosyltransferase YjiC (YdhE family)